MSIFQGKVCVVTGGGSGLGLSICLQLASRGAHVIIADIQEEAASETAKIITSQGKGTAVPKQLDVTDPAAVEKLIQDVVDRFGKLDYMFNNAGIIVIGEFRDIPLVEIQKVIDVNLTGALNGSYYAYQLMVKQGFGHIVNTASGFGLAPGPSYLPYVTSKFGVVGMSESLRMEGADLGVSVSVVCPGYIRTPLIEKLRTYRAEPKEAVSLIPVKLLEPDKAAEVILRGVEKNKPIIMFPSYVRFLVSMYRMFPRAFLSYALKNIRSFRKIRI